MSLFRASTTCARDGHLQVWWYQRLYSTILTWRFVLTWLWEGCVCSGGSWWRFKVLGVQTSIPHTNRPVQYSIDHTDKHLHNTVYSHYTHTHTYTSYYLILYSAENHMLQLNIWCSWWWAYVPETCRAKNTLVKSPCCIKLAFQIISLEVYLLVVCGCDV